MIPVPVSTVEKPLTVIDFIASLEYCVTPDEVRDYGDRVPMEYRSDERFTRGVRRRLDAIRDKNKAAA